jgi:hypothetical protein
MTSAKRAITGAAIGLILVSLGLLMIRTGTYGLTLFVALPVAVGAFGSWVMRPKNGVKAAMRGWLRT